LPMFSNQGEIPIEENTVMHKVERKGHKKKGRYLCPAAWVFQKLVAQNILPRKTAVSAVWTRDRQTTRHFFRKKALSSIGCTILLTWLVFCNRI